MPSENEGFKVSDRRLFTEDGDLRPDVERDAGSEAAPHPADPTPQVGDSAAQSLPMTFDTLVLSLSTTAMMQLGVIGEGPDHKTERDLPAAQQSISILELLKEKTKGNLTQQEMQLLDASLYDLKMTYLQLTKQVKL
ncbi:MAG: DUF1844 domain-containing protein [Acidobacteriota bacterium]